MGYFEGFLDQEERSAEIPQQHRRHCTPARIRSMGSYALQRQAKGISSTVPMMNAMFRQPKPDSNAAAETMCLLTVLTPVWPVL